MRKIEFRRKHRKERDKLRRQFWQHVRAGRDAEAEKLLAQLLVSTAYAGGLSPDAPFDGSGATDRRADEALALLKKLPKVRPGPDEFNDHERRKTWKNELVLVRAKLWSVLVSGIMAGGGKTTEASVIFLMQPAVLSSDLELAFKTALARIYYYPAGPGHPHNHDGHASHMLLRLGELTRRPFNPIAFRCLFYKAAAGLSPESAVKLVQRRKVWG